MDDVQAMEFYLKNKEVGMKDVLQSHRLNDASSLIIKMVVTAAVYPHYAILDQYNSYKVGNELFAHTRNKPFAVLHPNGCLALMPEALDYDRSDQGLSRYHQLVAFATFMETTKPFMCSSIRIPALMLLLVAKSVQCSEERHRILCDDFVEFGFVHAIDFFMVAQTAASIRRRLAVSLARRVQGDTLVDRTLTTTLVSFLRSDVEFIMSRRACPDPNVAIGFVLPSGELLEEEIPDGSESVSSLEFFAQSDKNAKLEQDVSSNKTQNTKKAFEYFCDNCKRKLSFDSAVDVLRHKRSHL